MPAPYDQIDYFPLRAFAFEALAVAGTAVGFTAATIAGARMATVKVEGAQVRYRTDGTAPTATVGTILDVGDSLIVWGSADVQAILFIRTGGVSATLASEFSR